MASKKSLTKEAKMKRSFRNSSTWKNFRKKVYDNQCGKDFLTLKPLNKTFNVHHRNLNVDEYQNIENEDMFVGLNKTSHDTVHFLLRYIKSYHSLEVLDRFYEEIAREALLNGFITEEDYKGRKQ